MTRPAAGRWQAKAAELGLKRRGTELVGPCPSCGGSDRFHVRLRDGVFGCRRCGGFEAILRAAGFQDDRNRHDPACRRTWKPASGSVRKAGTGRQGQSPADAILRGARPDPGPLRAMLAARGVWPPWEKLPDSLRWIDAGSFRKLRLKSLGMPAGAAGGAVYAFTGGKQGAVQLEPLTGSGERLAWPDGAKRRTFGSPSGAAFLVPGDPGMALAVCEGPADALAIRTWRGNSAAAAGGTGGLPRLAPRLAADRRKIEIHADGDGPGAAAAVELADSLHLLGRTCRIEFYPRGQDPADSLAEEWTERTAIIIADGGLTEQEAARAAWNAMKGPGQ